MIGRRFPLRVAATILLLLTGLQALGPAPAVATPGPPSAPEYWFDSWHITALWDEGVRGQGVTIAEIDTGVAEIPELDGRVLPGVDLGSPGGDGRIDREVNGFGHGTAMASIMVARTGLLGITGIAPDAKILPIAVPLAGTTDSDEPDHLAEAIRYATDHGAKIINMSLGGQEDQSSGDRACGSDEQSAIYHAISKGAVVVASIGNTGPTRNVIEDPAVCLGVVAVGAVDVAGNVASFSTRQPYLALVAPGVSIPSLGRTPGVAYKGSGTSQATALTSASLALVWSKYPTLTGSQIVARVLATLDDRRSTRSPAYGFGLLDTFRAVTSKVALNSPDPVYASARPFITRAAALAAAAPKPPPPASVRPVDAGSFSVGGTQRLSSRWVILGIAMAALGLVVLLLVLLGWVRRRRILVSTGGPEVMTPFPAGPAPQGPAGPPAGSVQPIAQAPSTAVTPEPAMNWTQDREPEASRARPRPQPGPRTGHEDSDNSDL